MPISPEAEPTTIGLSPSAHGKLQRLKEDGYFPEMVDAYRFAVALAIAHGVAAPKISGSKSTIFNVGSLDPDRSIHLAVSAFRGETGEPVYRTAERLAEWGVEELFRRMQEGGRLSVAEILAEAESLT